MTVYSGMSIFVEATDVDGQPSNAPVTIKIWVGKNYCSALTLDGAIAFRNELNAMIERVRNINKQRAT